MSSMIKIPGLNNSSASNSSDDECDNNNHHDEEEDNYKKEFIKTSSSIKSKNNDSKKKLNEELEKGEYIPTGLTPSSPSSPIYIPLKISNPEVILPIVEKNKKRRRTSNSGGSSNNTQVRKYKKTKVKGNGVGVVVGGGKKSVNDTNNIILPSITPPSTTTTSNNIEMSSLTSGENNMSYYQNFEIINDLVILLKCVKTSFDINTQIPMKYYKNMVPIFNKGIRNDIFVKREHSDNLWLNINIKNIDMIKMPIAIYKIINVDDDIINNLKIRMNNIINFTTLSINNELSDKNYQIFDESGIIIINDEENNKDKGSLYMNARIELKKNVTYIFNLSLNIMFYKNFINIQSEYYKCSLQSRNDNNYLACLVINALNNYTLENNVKLMQYISYN